MPDHDVVVDDLDIDSEEGEDTRRDRRWWGLLAIVVLLPLLLFGCVTAAQVWVTGGKQQARFMARNIECLQCHTELIPDFSKTTVHNPFAMKECTTCHTPHGKKVTMSVTSGPGAAWMRYRTMLQWLPLKWWFQVTERTTSKSVAVGEGKVIATKTVQVKGGKSLLVAPEEDLCWTCHGSMGRKLDDRFTHQPFAAGRCSNCHDPHASDYKSLLAQAPDKICFTCHPMGMELNREQAHPPAAQGWCIDCHDPHASNFKGIIVRRQRELCFGCHPSVAMKESMPVQHSPFVNDNCTGCHQPHGSNYRPLLNAVQPDLCYDCHPQIEDQFAQPSHHPVGVVLKCASCHDPHAAQYGALVSARDNSFCYQCHRTVQANYDGSKHRRTLCIKCHTPHGSTNTPMLLAANPEVCLQCHEATHFDERTSTVYRNNHPVRPTHYDVNNQSPLTCTSSCHNPHGTKQNYMLRYFAFPTDGACLMCHAASRGNRVGIDY